VSGYLLLWLACCSVSLLFLEALFMQFSVVSLALT
jgi:hypothetical protein